MKGLSRHALRRADMSALWWIMRAMDLPSARDEAKWERVQRILDWIADPPAWWPQDDVRAALDRSLNILKEGAPIA